MVTRTNNRERESTTRSALLNVMARAAHKAANSLKRDFGEVENLQISRKGPGDFVTRADKQAEKIIREVLQAARPDYGFLGEEGGQSIKGDGIHTWIVDPLDGTTNFLHGFAHFCISIALQKNNEIIAGAIYDPMRDELFTAEKGLGAYLNDKRLKVSKRRDMSTALPVTGIPFGGQKNTKPYLQVLESILNISTGVRRTGSAALDFAYVAAGRFDAYFEMGLNAWDAAAGLLIVREANGIVTDFNGKPATPYSESFLASNIDLHPEFLKLIKSAKA